MSGLLDIFRNELPAFWNDAKWGGKLNAELPEVTAGDVANFGLDMTPVVGGVKGAGEEWDEGNYGWSAFNAATVPMDLMSMGVLGTMARNVPKSFKKLYGINKGDMTVKDPQRAAFPDIYDNPADVAQRAAQNTAPENPAMKELFGVNRDDLYEMHKGRVGNEAPNVKFAAKPKGAAAGQKIMNKRNTQRIVDVLSEAEKYPELYKGMDSWYEMQPLLDRFKEISDTPIEDFLRFNQMTGMASSGSDVLTELNRGTGALHLWQQGRWDDFLKHGGKALHKRTDDFPDDMRGIMGHPYHSTAHGIPMNNYVQTGSSGMDSPKVPLYIQSAGTPESGFQTALPVGDAHFSRGVGLADVRTNKDFGASISTPELQTIGDWWANDVAGNLGINSVDAQARAWGTFAPATGVDTPVGAPKLELISQKIMDASKAYGIPPEQARDMILMGEAYAPNVGLLGLNR